MDNTISTLTNALKQIEKDYNKSVNNIAKGENYTEEMPKTMISKRQWEMTIVTLKEYTEMIGTLIDIKK